MEERAVILALHTGPAVELPKVGERRRFRKELIHVGQFIKASDNLPFEVTRERINHWAETHRRYSAAGNKVPLPKAHFQPDGTPYTQDDAEANRGWVLAMSAEGDSLYADVELIGPDADTLAASNDVSVYIPPTYTDGKGNVYQQPILHVALTPFPVIPGLKPFEALAASQPNTPAAVPVLSLSQEPNMADPNMDPNAATAGTDPADAIVASIMEKVTAAVKDKAKTAQEKTAIFKDLMKKLEKALGVFDETPAPEAATSAATAAPVAASMTPDPMVSRLLVENYGMKIERLASAGKLNGPQRKLLEDKAATLALSRDAVPYMDQAIALAELAEPTLVGERTGPQLLTLSDPRKGGMDDATKAEGDAMVARVKARANIK